MTFGWAPVRLGRTEMDSSSLGLGSSFGLGARDVERAFERGIRYLYWGSVRADDFGQGIRAVARKDRARLVLVVQSYTRMAALMKRSLTDALKELGTEYTDFLLLGWWNEAPPERLLEAALSLREKGLCKHILISCHHRPTFAQYAADLRYGGIMVRYNAAHTGAEQEVFPHVNAMDPSQRPAVVAYTATRWAKLLDPSLTPPGEATPKPSDCYRFALSDPHVNVVLAGPRNGEDLDEAMRTLDLGPMSEEERAWMRRVGAAVRASQSGSAGLHPINLADKVVGAVSRLSHYLP